MNKIKRNFFAILSGVKYKLISILKKDLNIGSNFRIFKNSELRVYSKAKCIIGNEVKIDYNTVISVTKDSNLTLKNNVGIGSNSMIVCHKSIYIGENTLIGPNVYIYDHDHKFSKGRIKRKEYICKDVIIGDNCWIGACTVILKGTKIGSNCIIGAGSIVTGEIPDNTLFIQKREKVLKDID